jgi:hypothetical protein
MRCTIRRVLLPWATIAIAVLLSCEEDTPTGTSDTVASVWGGTYDATHNTDGLVENWTLYESGAMSGNWHSAAGSYTLGLSGTYELDSATNMSFDASGTVSVQGVVSGFTIAGMGAMDSATAHGTFTLDFVSPLFYDDTGSWVVTRVGP